MITKTCLRNGVAINLAGSARQDGEGLKIPVMTGQTVIQNKNAAECKPLNSRGRRTPAPGSMNRRWRGRGCGLRSATRGRHCSRELRARTSPRLHRQCAGNLPEWLPASRTDLPRAGLDYDPGRTRSCRRVLAVDRTAFLILFVLVLASFRFFWFVPFAVQS